MRPLLLAMALIAACASRSVAGDASIEVFRTTSKSAVADDLLYPIHDAGFRYVGTLSCTATACHGMIPVDRADRDYADDAYHGMEHFFWRNKDPHSRAPNTLTTEASKRILMRLVGPSGQAVTASAHYRNCESCHRPTPRAAGSGEHAIHGLPAQSGVGCESCHGPAEQWLDVHMRPAFRQLSSIDKASWGMVDTKSLAVRSALCAECHVGSAAPQLNGQPMRQVNHDMIAAGHPVLNFELVAYQDCLPKHWNSAAEQAAIADYRQQLWAYGQIANCRAALALLRYRATTTDAVTVWPDLSEYTCTSCHADLLGAFRPARPRAELRLRRWNYTLAPLALEALTGQPSTLLSERLSTLRQLLVPAQQVTPDALSELNEAIQLTRTQHNPTDLHVSIPALLKRQDSLSDDWDVSTSGDWDVSTQRFLAMFACCKDLEHTGPGSLDEAACANLRAVRASVVDLLAPSGDPVADVKRLDRAREMLQSLIDVNSKQD